MITPSQVLGAANALAVDGTITERFDTFDVSGIFTAPVFQHWQKIALDPQLSGKIFAIDALGDQIDWNGQIPHGSVRITFTKEQRVDSCYFFSACGMAALLGDTRAAACRTVFVAENFQAFDTESCKFRGWKLWTDKSEWETEIKDTSPNRLIKDLGSFSVPVSVMPFLISGPLPTPSAVFLAWKNSACKSLFLSLVNEVWMDNNLLRVNLTGPRARKIDFNLAEINPTRDFPMLSEAAVWVYGSRRDTELRHTLFTYELAREWDDNLSLVRGFADRATFALEAAKISFHAYISNSSKDTLKSLGDVRKSLGEEVNKISQQTRELISSLWKDFAIAVTALLGRIALSSAGKLSDPVAMKAVLYGTAFFLLASISISLYMNFRFLLLSKQNRTSWSEKLYGFLSPEDRNILAIKPLDDAENLYRNLAFLISIIYLAIAGVLVYVA